MFLQNTLDYFNGLTCGELNSNELEVKILLDPRIISPIFTKSQFSQSIQTSTNTVPTKTSELYARIDIIKKIIRNCNQYGDSSISQTINFIHTENTQMFIKQLCFNNGVQDKEKKNYYIKKSLVKPIYLISDKINQPSYKLSINDEIKQSKDINKFDIIRFRSRYTIVFNTDSLKKWKLELTLVNETKNISIQNIKEIKDRLFTKNINNVNFLDEVDWVYSDKIELELEYTSTENININDIKHLDILWEPIQSVYKSYLDCVCQIAQIIKPHTMNKFKSEYFGLKQLGTNPIELTKKCYMTNILSDINNFILTEKIDGIRSMLIIYPKKGECHIINKTYRYMKIPVCQNEIIDLIILDSEEYTINSLNPIYYIFDCIWCDTNVSELPFSSINAGSRLDHITKIVDKYDFLVLKHFIQLNNSEYSNQILDFNNLLKDLPYETDGFIFISKDASYNNTKNYKWKPIEKMTIDFVAKKCPDNLLGINPYINKDNKTLYLLFSGIRSNEYKKLGIQKFKNYDNIFKHINYSDKYFPIQFSPSSNPYAYLFWSENKCLDNNIIELNRKNNEWNLFKIRTDRKIDMDRKTYYGNYFKIAESIWMNYINPLNIENLIETKNNEYFQADNNDHYKYVRKFNNFVKNTLIIMYTQKKTEIECFDWVIDLAAGKGQDLFKYIDCGIKNIFMIDNDTSALSEIINRKYTYINDINIKHCTKLFIKHMDLSKPYKQNYDKINESYFGVPSQGVPLIVCNLALHYLIPNKTKTLNFCNLLNKLLSPGGIFIFTAFNGRKIFDKLKESGEWSKYNNNNKLLYSIKRKYSGDLFTGTNQKIDVLLPFSNGEYYSEYLINDELLENELLKKKIKLINKDSFSIYQDKFKEYNQHFFKALNTIDKDFISLYSFYIFHKTNNRR